MNGALFPGKKINEKSYNILRLKMFSYRSSVGIPQYPSWS